VFDAGGSLQKTQNFVYDNGHRDKDECSKFKEKEEQKNIKVSQK